MDSFPLYLILLYESGELIRIYKGLQRVIVTDDLRNKFRLFIKGPVFSSLENPSSGLQQPRDIAFELFMASVFGLSGFTVDFHTMADLRANKGENTFFVECKRPRTIHSVRPAVRFAASQLRERYKSAGKSDHIWGIIALSIDKIVNPDDKLLIPEDEQEMDRRFNHEAEQFVRNYQIHWKKIPDFQTLGVVLLMQLVAIPQSHKMATDCSFLASNNI